MEEIQNYNEMILLLSLCSFCLSLSLLAGLWNPLKHLTVLLLLLYVQGNTILLLLFKDRDSRNKKT